MLTAKKKEKAKLIKCFLILKPCDSDQRKVSIVTKYQPSSSVSEDNCDEEQKLDNCEDIDESSLGLFCLPNGGEISKCEHPPEFHSFLITKQNGSRIFGSSLIVWDKITNESSETKYCNRSLCFLTSVPFVVATKRLLIYIWRSNCSLSVIDSICNVKMPAKGSCLKLRLPEKSLSSKNLRDFHTPLVKNSKFEEIFIYRGLPNFPSFDYPLRQLFIEILSPEQFLTAFTATLLELQILIISKSYYNLMLVAEALTSLLLPFSWQHVYVPILPSKLGLHFLDAPTPYIMGINASASESEAFNSLSTNSSTHSIQCRVNCDLNKVEFVFQNESAYDSTLPIKLPFIDELKSEIDSIISSDLRLSTQVNLTNRNQSEALKRITELARKHKVIKSEFSYLEDLKFNQSIRLAFMRCINKHILLDHEKFIINGASRKESVTFDAVSYLCDQPDSIKTFLTKFLKAQMFVSFIDKSVKRLQKSKQTLYSSHSSLKNQKLSEEMTDTLINDTFLESRFENAQEFEFTEIINDTSLDGTNNSYPDSRLLASPVRNRHARNKGFDPKSPKHFARAKADIISNGNFKGSTESIFSSPMKVPAALAAQTNWKVVESLLKEVQFRTKRIVLAKMGTDEIAPLGMTKFYSLLFICYLKSIVCIIGIGLLEDMEENTLIASLCDLIERVWSHARSNDNENVKCAFWSHLATFAALENDEDDDISFLGGHSSHPGN